MHRLAQIGIETGSQATPRDDNEPGGAGESDGSELLVGQPAEPSYVPFPGTPALPDYTAVPVTGNPAPPGYGGASSFPPIGLVPVPAYGGEGALEPAPGLPGIPDYGGAGGQPEVGGQAGAAGAAG